MTYDQALVHHVERSLRRDCGLGHVHPDADGDYRVLADGVPVYVRPLLAGSPPLVRVWAPAATEVKRSAALLTELNELNVAMQLLRCLWHDGSVIIAGETEAAAIGPGTLGRLVAMAGNAARHTGELVAAVYGGERPLHPERLDPHDAGRG